MLRRSIETTRYNVRIRHDFVAGLIVVPEAGRVGIDDAEQFVRADGRRSRQEVAAVAFRARLEQIINMKHELVQLAGKIDWEWIDSEIAPLCSDKGRPGIETRFVIGLLLLKHIYGLSDEGVCERWVHDPYFRVPRTLAGTSAVLC